MEARRLRGFTLVEMVITIVLLGIVAAVLAPVISGAFTAFSDTKDRADLTARGRSALERLGRELRHAVPNSLQVVPDLSGNPIGIEFVRSVGGGRYVSEFDAFGTAFTVGDRRFSASANRTELYVLGTGLSFVANELLIIGNTAPSQLAACTIAGGCPNGVAVLLTGTGPTTSATDGTDDATVLTFANHVFASGSPGRHYLVADDVIEVGLSGTSLRWLETSDFTTYDGTQNWSTVDPVLVHGIATSTDVAFTYNPGTPSASGILQVALTLTQGDESIRLYQEYHVRNTP